jgi:hypothetical protein
MKTTSLNSRQCLRVFAPSTLLLLGLSFLFGQARVLGADFVWTNLAGGNWNTAANWSPNTVPNGATHVAVITNAGTYAVTNNGNRTLGGFMVGGASGMQTMAHSAGYTLTVNGPGSVLSNGRLNLFNGPFTGTNVVTVDGQVNWNYGSIGDNAVFLISTNGRLNLAGSNDKFFNGAITNAGTITWTDSGDFQQYGIVHNLPGGLIEALTNGVMNASAGSLLVNEGTIRKSGGTGNTDLEPLLVNSGTFEAQTGSLRFLSQGKTFITGTRFIGTGTNLLSGGTATLAGDIEAENLLWGGASLGGAGRITGNLRWTSGNLAADGALTLAPSGVLRVEGASTKAVYGSLTNAGTIVWTGTGNLNFYGTGLVLNAASGLFEAQNDALLDYINGTPAFINDGVFRKTTGTGTTLIQIAFINNGTVDAQTGTINLTQEDKTFNAGCRFTGAGRTTLTQGTVTLNGTLESENLLLAGATLAGQGGVSGGMSWTSGAIAAGSSFTVAADGVFRAEGALDKAVHGALTNAGQVIWSGTGKFNFYGTGLVHNAASGLFEAQNDELLDFISGTPVFINDGVFRKTTSTGTTSIQIAFINNGTVDAQTGTINLAQEAKTFNAGCRFTGAGLTTLTLGVVTLNGTIDSENLVLAGATLSGAGSVNGSFTWNSGTLSPDVSFNVTHTGILTLASASTKVINGSITNAGRVIWLGTGNLQVRGAIHNLSGGRFEIQNDEVLDHLSGTPVFVNDGVIRKTVATGTTVCQIAFVNQGTVDIQTGVFQLTQEPKTLNAGCRFTGAGRTTLVVGNVTLNGTIESENLSLDGASLLGAGSVNGSFTWNSGTLTPDISFNVTTNGLLLLASSGNKDLNGTITNAGTVRWTGTGNLRVRGAIHNLPPGLFDAQNNEVLDFISGSPVIVNEGAFRKSAGTATTFCQIPFHNFGRVEVNSGTLSFVSDFTDQAGTIALGGGTLLTAQPVALAGGQLLGAGTLRPGFGAAALLTSAATVAPAATGVLQIQGNYHQLLPGVLNFALAGTDPGTNHSRLVITGDATFAGTIGVQRADGYLPAEGDRFEVMSFRSRTGDFACYNGFLLLGHDRRLITEWGTTNLTLVTASAPDPTNAIPRVTAQYPSAIVCWPAEFTGWQLYATTNLAAPAWQPLPSATNRWFEAVMDPEKFFRLQPGN